MSLSTLYNNARQSLLTFQAATNVTGQNIANAETPGYTRRRLSLAPSAAARGGVLFHGPGVGSGGGVTGTSLDRVRSGILDTAVRRGRAGSEGASTSAQLLATLESQLAPDGGDGLLGALSGFWDAWSTVADSPTDTGARDSLLASAGHLAGTLGAAAERVEAFGAAVADDLGRTVERTNGLLEEIAALNGAIRGSNVQTGPDLNAMDRRDAALDALAGLAPIQVRNQDDGTVTVTFNGMIGVEGTEAQGLRVVGPPDAPLAEVRPLGSNRALTFSATGGGEIGAHLDLLRRALPETQAALDGLAADVVGRVNDAHRRGVGLDGSTDLDFFDPAGTTARTLRVSDLLPSPDAIASAATGGSPGDGRVAATIAGVGEDLQGAATRMLSRLGASVRTAVASADANAAYAEHAAALRDGVSKVSMDEEMTQLIRYQQAYAASARVLETATSLFDTILAL